MTRGRYLSIADNPPDSHPHTVNRPEMCIARSDFNSLPSFVSAATAAARIGRLDSIPLCFSA